MQTTIIHCDLCKAEVQGKMGVFVFNDVIVDSQFRQIPVSKQADFCEACAEKVRQAIDEIAKTIKVEDFNEDNQTHEENHTALYSPAEH